MLKQITAPDLKASATSQGAMPTTASPSGLAPPDYASRKAALLFGCYRKADANDPEVYVAGAAAILSEYASEIVDYVCDPRTGLARRLKWLPTLAEIAEACEQQVERAKTVASIREKAARCKVILADPSASDGAKFEARRVLDMLPSRYTAGVT